MTPKKKEMKIVVDYHNTITSFPEVLKRLGDLYIVTASAQSKEYAIESYLKEKRITYKKLFVFPGEWNDNISKAKAKLWKINKIIDLAPDILIDDDLKVLLIVRKSCPNTTCLQLIVDTFEIVEEPKKKVFLYDIHTGEYLRESFEE